MDAIALINLALICRHAALAGIHSDSAASQSQDKPKILVGLEALPLLSSVSRLWHRVIHDNADLFYDFSSCVITHHKEPLLALKHAARLKFALLPRFTENGMTTPKASELICNFLDSNLFARNSSSQFQQVLQLLASKPPLEPKLWTTLNGYLTMQESKVIDHVTSIMDPLVSILGGLIIKNGVKLQVGNARLCGLGIALFHSDLKYADCFNQQPHQPLETTPTILFWYFSALRKTSNLLLGSETKPTEHQKEFNRYCTPEIQEKYLNPAPCEKLFGIIEAFAKFHRCTELLDKPLTPEEINDPKISDPALKTPLSLREYAAALPTTQKGKLESLQK